MVKLRVKSIVGNGIEDLVKYRKIQPTKITLSEEVYKQFVKEVEEDMKGVSYFGAISGVVEYMGIPVVVDYSDSVKIIVE